jgi:hypothetical protein
MNAQGTIASLLAGAKILSLKPVTKIDQTKNTVMSYSYIKIFFFSIGIAVFFSCSKEATGTGDSASSLASSGAGGSLAKLTIVGNYLYTVDSHFLYAYDISNPTNPFKTSTSPLNFDMETIYPFNNRLFIGTKTGLYIYSIDSPAVPKKIGEAKHARSCDPVVANDSIAFVTLKGNSFCGPATSGLYVHNIKNLFLPVLIKTVPINSPEGLGLQDSVLYVCCNNDGLKVYNVSNPGNPVEKATITGEYFRDVIPYNQLLICFVADGLTLYNIANPQAPVLIKHIAD